MADNDTLFAPIEEKQYKDFSGTKAILQTLSEDDRKKYPFFVEIPYDPEHGYDSMMERWSKGITSLSAITPEIVELFVNSYAGVPAAMTNYFELRFLSDTNVILPFARRESNFDSESKFHMGYFERAVAKVTEHKNLPLWILYRNPERKDKSGKVFDVPHVGTLYRYDPFRGHITLLVKGSPRTFKLSRIQSYAVVPASCSNLLQVKFELSEDGSRVLWEASPERFPEMWGYLSSLELLSLELAREREAEKKRWLQEEKANQARRAKEERIAAELEKKEQAQKARKEALRLHEEKRIREEKAAEAREAQRKAREEKRRADLRKRQEAALKLAEEQAREEALERERQQEKLRRYQEKQRLQREAEERAKREKEARLLAEIKERWEREEELRKARELELERQAAEERMRVEFIAKLKSRERDASLERISREVNRKLEPLDKRFREVFSEPLGKISEIALGELTSQGLAMVLGARLNSVLEGNQELRELFMTRIHGELAQDFDEKYRGALLEHFKGVYVEIEDLTKGSRMFMSLRDISVDPEKRTITFGDGASRYGAGYDAFRLRKVNDSQWLYAPLWSKR